MYEGEILYGIKYPRRPPISALKDSIANRSSVVSRFEKGISGGLWSIAGDANSQSWSDSLLLGAREIHRAVRTENIVDNEGSNQATHF